MNAILEIAVIVAAVGLAALFVALRVVKALRGGKPSCCTDGGEVGLPVGTASCPDRDDKRLDGKGLYAKEPDGKLKPRPSYCTGCTSCGARG